MSHRKKTHLTQRARELRARQTKAESLLWSALRCRRLCGLKFRRQHAIGPFIADFSCVDKKLVVEIDGGYHDFVQQKDAARQQRIEAAGWRVIRVANEDVLDDVDAVALGIARHLGLPPEFRGRQPT